MRPKPLFGFGNEWVFQSNWDTKLNSALSTAYSQIGRFPGGTPADYWLWSDGWVNVTSDRSGCSKLPRRATTVSDLNKYLTATNQTTVLVLNQLQTDVSYQIEGLQAHQAAGTSVKFIELGNEMYDATRPDVLEMYPEPSDYAVRMADWTSKIKAVFPDSSVALVGLANDWDNRTRAWNKQVLQNPVSQQADAATIHLYPGLPTANITVSMFPQVLSLAFSTFAGYESYTNSTIPSRFRLWVTEWGTWGNTFVLNTWLQGLWHATLVLQLPSIPRIDVILPYCAVCGDPNMPSFTSQYGPIEPVNATDTNWTRTASGHIYAQIFETVHASASLDALHFSPNPNLDPSVPASTQLAGFAAMSTSNGDGDRYGNGDGGDIDGKSSASVVVDSIVAVNLGRSSFDLDVSGLKFACWQQGFNARVENQTKQQQQQQQQQLFYDMYFPKTVDDVMRQNLQVSDLGHENQVVAAAAVVTISPYGVVRVYCS